MWIGLRRRINNDDLQSNSQEVPTVREVAELSRRQQLCKGCGGKSTAGKTYVAMARRAHMWSRNARSVRLPA